MAKSRQSRPPYERTDGELKEAARKLSLVAHPARLRILYVLAEASRTSGELCELTGETPVMFSHHVKLIRTAGLVDTDREGRFVRYSLSPLGRAAIEAAQAIRAAEQ